MDQNTQSSSPKSSSPTKFILPVAVIAIIILAAVFWYTQNSQTESLQETVTPSVTTNETQMENEQAMSYTDGTYEAEGSYISPGGPRTIDMTITIQDGVITDSTFVGNATDPTSQRFQGEFGDNYQPMIIGKNIDEVSLTKVAGSSLTPQGFTDALEQIKAQAQS